MKSNSRSSSHDFITRTYCVPPRTPGIRPTGLKSSRSRSFYKTPFITNLTFTLEDNASLSDTPNTLGRPFRKTLPTPENDSVICRYNNTSTHCFKTQFIPSPYPNPEFEFLIDSSTSPPTKTNSTVSNHGDYHSNNTTRDTRHQSTFEKKDEQILTNQNHNQQPSKSIVSTIRPQLHQRNSNFYKLQNFYEEVESGHSKRQIQSLPNLSVNNSGSSELLTNQSESQFHAANKIPKFPPLPPHLRRRVDQSEEFNSTQIIQALTQENKKFGPKEEAGELGHRQLTVTKSEKLGSEHSPDLEDIVPEWFGRFDLETEIRPILGVEKGESYGDFGSKVIWSSPLRPINQPKVKPRRDLSLTKSMDTCQPSRYLTDLEWRVCHAVNIYVYRNGVENHSPMLVHIPPSKKANMKLVLQVLNDRVKYPIGYAKSLFKMDGSRIQHPSELEMYNNYVIASNHDKHFKCVQYGRKRSPLLVLNTISSKHARAMAERSQRSSLAKKTSSATIDNLGFMHPCPLLERKTCSSTPTLHRKCSNGRGVPMSMSHFGRPPVNVWNNRNEAYPRSPCKDLGEDGQSYLNITPSRVFSLTHLNANHKKGVDVLNVSMDPPETAFKRNNTPHFLDYTNDLDRHSVKDNIDDDVSNDNFITELLLRNSQQKLQNSSQNSYEKERSNFQFPLTNNNSQVFAEYSESSEFDDDETDSYPNSDTGQREEHPNENQHVWTNQIIPDAEKLKEELKLKIENGNTGSVTGFQDGMQLQPMTTKATYVSPRGGQYTIRHHLKESCDQLPASDSMNSPLNKFSLSTLESNHSLSNGTTSFSSFGSESQVRQFRDLNPLPSPLPFFFGQSSQHPTEVTLSKQNLPISQLSEKYGSYTGKYNSLPEPHELLLPTLNRGFLLTNSHVPEYRPSKTEFPFVSVTAYPAFTPLEFPRELLQSQGFSFLTQESQTDLGHHNQFQLISPAPISYPRSRRRQRHIQEYSNNVNQFPPQEQRKEHKDMGVQTIPSDFLYRPSLQKVQPRPSSIAPSAYHRLGTKESTQRKEFQNQISEQMLPGYEHRRIKKIDRMSGTISPPLLFQNVDIQTESVAAVERERTYSILTLPPPTPFADSGMSLCRRSSSSVEPGMSQTMFRTPPTPTLSSSSRRSKPSLSPLTKPMTYHVEDFIFKKGKKSPLRQIPTKNVTPQRPSNFKIRMRR